MNGDTYERWVAGIDMDTGAKKGCVRDDANALRFVEVVVNGPKTEARAVQVEDLMRVPTAGPMIRRAAPEGVGTKST